MAASIGGPERRIVLVGRNGSGKSAMGNTILGSKVFKSGLLPSSRTKTFQKEETQWNGRNIVVVDTPDIFNTNCSELEANAELRNCVTICPPGPHVVLWVRNPGQVMEEGMTWLTKVIFHEKDRDYVIILFTHKDELECESSETFTSDEFIKEFLADCENRYLLFNNKAEGAEREAQVAELMTMIDQLVYENGDAPYYTEDMLRENIENFKNMFASCPLF